jgi:VWFA-related protein
VIDEPHEPHRLGKAGALGALAVLVCVALASAAGVFPLTTADIVKFLRAGISEGTILTELGNRGFGETLDPARETALREAGASETLVVAIRRVALPSPAATGAPLPGSPAPPSPGAAGTLGVTFGSATRTVRVPVFVLDKNGEPVLGLQEQDFRLLEDGKRQTLSQFSSERRPLRLALALDLSGSMRRKIVQVEESLKHFIDLLETNDEIMVITFNGDVRIAQDFTSDRDQLGVVLDGLEPEGSTALYDAAHEAIRRVATAPAEARAVVLITDGVDTASRVTFDILREYARRSEVPVFSIGIEGGDEGSFGSQGGPPPGGGGGHHGGGGFPGGGFGGGGRGGGAPWGGGGHTAGHREGFDAKPLQELADDTGGRAHVVKGFDHYTPGVEGPTSGPLKAAVESIAATLRHRYLLGYEPPAGKSGWRVIGVDVLRPSAATARARKGYYPG